MSFTSCLPALLLCLLATVPASGASSTLAHLPNSTVNAVQVDHSGNIYVAGFQGTPGSSATNDAFVAKLSPDGSQVLYSTKLAGSKSDIASALGLDSTGAAYIFGVTQSPDFPTTAGAQQTAFQASSTQGFAAKLDAKGNVVYSTLVGGSANTYSARGLLVDSAGNLYISAISQGNIPNASTAVTGADNAFTMKLDPAGKSLVAIQGLGGPLTLDGQGALYVAGSIGSNGNAIPVTANAFQSTFELHGCGGTAQVGLACSYQYVVKLNPALSQVVFATYVTGSYGATPAAISVDGQGNVWTAGTTNSPDYPTTPDAYQPLYIANAAPGPQVNLFGTTYPPPASGFVTELNPTGTELVYSTLFSGTQADTITFAAFDSTGVHFAGSAGSSDLPGLDGVPSSCLPENYESSINLDGTAVTAARIVNGTVLAYDSVSGTFLAWTGVDLVRADPDMPPSAISCILDAADMRPVTSIAPGELLAIFGPRFTNGAYSQPLNALPKSLFGVAVTFNGVAAPILYLANQQLNVQAPFEIAGATPVNVALTLQDHGPVAASLTLPGVVANPTAFLDTTTPLSSVSFNRCPLSGLAYSGGPLPLAFNPDGSRNTCSNPAPAGSPITILLQGLGATGPSVTGGLNTSPGVPLTLPVTGTYFTTPIAIGSGSALAGSLNGVWQVAVRFTVSDTGALPVNLSVTLPDGQSVPVRDANLTLWVK